MTALANAIGLAPPQTVLGFLFGQVHVKDNRGDLTAPMINRYKSRSPRSLSALARELDPERRAPVRQLGAAEARPARPTGMTGKADALRYGEAEAGIAFLA
jgi:hypothetical protein